MADQALLDRLKRYSKNCLKECTDGDFADAVWEAVEVIDGLLNDLQEALDTVDELQSQLPRWIPVTERLPEQKGCYLVFSHGVIGTAYYGSKWWTEDPRIYEPQITHWMPMLPEPPKDGE